MSERAGGARCSGDWEARRSQAPWSSLEADSPCLTQCVCWELHSWVEANTLSAINHLCGRANENYNFTLGLK